MSWDDADFASDDPLVRFNAHQAAKGNTPMRDPDLERKHARESDGMSTLCESRPLPPGCTGFGDCDCDVCFPPESVYPLADGSTIYALRRRDWIAAACCGVAWTPGLLSIIGWAHHWNAYTNLTNALVCVVFWVVLWKSWSK